LAPSPGQLATGFEILELSENTKNAEKVDTPSVSCFHKSLIDHETGLLFGLAAHEEVLS
jgi:hypothetical protein